jgi:hypothetical protein
MSLPCAQLVCLKTGSLLLIETVIRLLIVVDSHQLNGAYSHSVPFKFFALLFFCESASYLNFVSDEPFCLFEFLHGVYLASIIYCSCMGRLQNLTWLILASVLFHEWSSPNFVVLCFCFRASSVEL